jgi:hypothetical protein
MVMVLYRYEQLLEPLGAFLASQDALHVEIIDEGAFFMVSWHDTVAGPVQRSFLPEELAVLAPVARVDAVLATRAALLGQLGREIDATQLNVARIVEGLDWFLVTGSCGGRYDSRRFPYHELQTRGGIATRGTSRLLPAAAPAGGGAGARTAQPPVVPMAVARGQGSPLRRRLQLS